MSRVLARRDDNWKKLQQYVLDERETFQLIGPGATPLYGVRRESTWFPRDGLFIKSPLRINGVTIGEADRRKAEALWVKREEQREKRRAERAAKRRRERGRAPRAPTPLTEDGVRQALEPGFVSAAYFLRFKFDPGHYALAGREKFEGRDVLKIEYYPSKLFSEGRTRPNKELRKRDEEIETKMNKVALVTLWVDPAEHQILKYDFQQHRPRLPAGTLARPHRRHERVDGDGTALPVGVAAAIAPHRIRSDARDRSRSMAATRWTTRLQARRRHHESSMTLSCAS